MEVTFSPSLKQDQMIEYFDDEITTEILWGGGAGGGKTYGICSLILMKCLQHPGIRVGLARNELTTLKKTTVVSLLKVANDWGITDLFNYNSTSGIIKFLRYENDSEIVLTGLAYKPSDPLYTTLGGLELTFGVIDEVTEVDEKGYDIFSTRLARWRNDEFGLKGICLMTCNPSKNWVWRKYYKPWLEGTLEPHQIFIPALVTDNPYISPKYIEQLKKGSLQDRERLLNGNWDYDDDPNALLDYDQIMNVWYGVPTDEELEKEKRYITCDIAFTSDKMVILIWQGMTVVEMIINPEGKLEELIVELAKKWNIPHYNIAYDVDGVGQFMKKRITTAKPINNGGVPFNKENYKNLKVQLFYKLAEKIKDNSVKIKSKKYVEEIAEELAVIKQKPSEKIGKLDIIDKGEMKKILGRSPDYADAMAYRMYFEFKNVPTRTFKIM